MGNGERGMRDEQKEKGGKRKMKKEKRLLLFPFLF
jgi:hypothetical protein